MFHMTRWCKPASRYSFTSSATSSGVPQNA